jgi:L-histidinal:NAD+ dehydrogenase and L-histidinol:NAD+ dehydrogenase
MAVISLAAVLDDPAKRIPINAMVRAAAVYPAKDDALIEGMRAQRLAYREQIRQLHRMDGEAYEVDIQALARSLRSLEEDIHSDATRELFGDPYVIDLQGVRPAIDAEAASA